MAVDVQDRLAREKAVRRGLILQAARGLFLEKGYESTTMDEIAERSELSKATLYLYFRCKDELHVALLHEALDDLNARLREAASELAPAPVRIRAIGRAYATFYREQPAFGRLLAHFHSSQQRLSSDVVHPCEDRLMEGMRILARALADGLDEGTLDSPLPVVELAAMFWASTYGLLRLLGYQTCRDCLGLDPELDTISVVEDAWKVLLRGLMASSAQADAGDGEAA